MIKPEPKINPEHILANFKMEGRAGRVSRYGKGHINDTYLVENKDDGSPDYILQKINGHVFPDVPALMHNLVAVTGHLRRKANLTDTGGNTSEAISPAGVLTPIPVITPVPVLTPVPTRESKYYYTDQEGSYWRLFLFIGDAVTYERIQDTGKAFQAGKAVGSFQARLSDLDERLYDSLPGLHHYNRRFSEFKAALSEGDALRITKATADIDFVMGTADGMQSYFSSLCSGGIPLRVTHNDTKVNNILFDRHGQAICLIDLDTVMPGYIHYDYGDALRTLASTAGEDEKELGKASFNMELFEAFTRGYLVEAKGFLSLQEAELLPGAPQYMTFIIGLRFLTDYLNGDIYFRVHKEDHNLVRARAQFQLLRDIMKKGPKMTAILLKYLS